MDGAQIEMEMRIQIAQNKLRKASEETENLRSELYETEQNINSLTYELSASEKINEYLRQQLKAQPTTQYSDDMDAENAKLMADNSALVRQLNVARAELQTAKGSILKPKSKCEKELSAVRAENDKLKSLLQDAQDEITLLISTGSHSSSADRDTGGPHVASLDKIDQLRSKLEAANTDIASMGSNPDTLLSQEDAAKVRLGPSSRDTFKCHSLLLAIGFRSSGPFGTVCKAGIRRTWSPRSATQPIASTP